MANANIRHEVFCFTRYNIQRILGSPKLYLILIILSCYILQLVFCPRTWMVQYNIYQYIKQI